MNKQTLFVSLTTAVMLCACQSSKVKISGRFVGNDAKDVYLEQVLPLTQSVIDSAVLDKDGNYRFELKGVTKTPSLYNVIYNGEHIPLFLAAGEKLSLNSVGSVVRNYTVEGSKESELLRQFYQAFVSGAQRLDNIASQFAKATLSEEDRQALVKEYTAEYYRIRREQLRFIIENKASLAAIYALYQRLPGDTYLFNGAATWFITARWPRPSNRLIPNRPPAIAHGGDRPHGRPHQSVVPDYRGGVSRPRAVGHLRQEGTPLVARGESRAARFLLGRAGNSNTLNAELKEVYKKYADAPVAFEVYQVAIDTSKPLWISAVQEQQLPWVSVSDLRGRASSSLGLYNVQKLPANFLIDKEGNIVGKDIYGKSLEQKLDELTR